MSDLLPRVHRAVARLCPPGCNILVACSGGPDSQVLLHLLAQLRQTGSIAELTAVGIDHGLRPEAGSELDVAEELSRTLAVRFERRRVDVEAGDNLLAEARRARYAALRTVAEELGADRIAVAHTASDQAETVLLNLSRGTGLRGAGGMRPRRGRIVRPLLAVTRAEVQAYVEQHRLPVAEDPSNLDPRRARAELRASVLPGLRRLNPAAERRIAAFARQARADDRLLRAEARRAADSLIDPAGGLELAGLATLAAPVAGRLLRLWLRRHGLRSGRRQLERLLAQVRDGQVGLSIGGTALRSDAGRLWAESGEPFAEALPIPGSLAVAHLGVTIESSEFDAAQLEFGNFREASEVAFDADRLHVGMEVRSWRRGDRLAPWGLDGHTNVGELFTNAKVPRALRPVWPLVTVGDEIAWVVGLRRGSLAPVSPATRRVVRLAVRGALPGSTW